MCLGFFNIMDINNIFKIILINKKLLPISQLFIFIYLASCGQQVMKDEGLESKSIESFVNANISKFKIVSVTPADGSGNYNSNIISFTFNKELQEWGTANSTDCDKQLFKISSDDTFGSCYAFGNNCGFSGSYHISGDYKTIRLCVVPFLALSTPHFIKVVESSDTGNLKSNDSSSFMEFTSSFTTGSN